MPIVPDKIKAQPSLFDAPPVSVADRMEMAWAEHRDRHLGKVVPGTWDSRQETIDRIGTHVWFPAERHWKCCKAIDCRDVALRKDPRKMEKHVKSYKHLAEVYGVGWRELIAFCKKRDKVYMQSADGHITGSTLRY